MNDPAKGSSSRLLRPPGPEIWQRGLKGGLVGPETQLKRIVVWAAPGSLSVGIRVSGSWECRDEGFQVCRDKGYIGRSKPKQFWDTYPMAWETL